MNIQQKNTVLALLKEAEAHRNYTAKYWLSYKDFLDPTEGFAEFCGDYLEGKSRYIDLINHLQDKDETARVFVEVYGFEENDDEEFIYADTLIIFSKLPLNTNS